MSTETMTRTVTTDTAEPVTVPALPADDRTGDWPYISFADARTRDSNGELFG